MYHMVKESLTTISQWPSSTWQIEDCAAFSVPRESCKKLLKTFPPSVSTASPFSSALITPSIAVLKDHLPGLWERKQRSEDDEEAHDGVEIRVRYYGRRWGRQ